MSVSLRLSRGGSKKRPYYRIVAADIRSPRDGRYLERLGTYNPMKQKNDPERISLNIERIKYWLSVGAKPTDRVTKFLANEGLAKKPSIPKQTKQDKPKKKTLEKLKAKEEKLKSKQEVKNAVVNNSGTLRADGIIKQGGKIFLTARNGKITNSGTVAANSNDNKAGSVRVTAEKIEINDEDYYSTDAFTDKAIEYIDKAKLENQDNPFFLYLSY